MTDAGNRPVRAKDARTIQFGGETLIYQFGTGEVHRLDKLGSIVWQLLDGDTTVDELVADLAAGFEADSDTIRADVAQLLAGMEQASLLDGGSEPARPPQPSLLTNPPSR